MERNIVRCFLAVTSALGGACYVGLTEHDGEGQSSTLGPTTVDVTSATAESPSSGDATRDATGPSSASAGDSTAAVDGTSGESGNGTTGEPAPLVATPENLRVAFFGDHGLGPDSLATLQLVLSEDADFLVVLGDFDYKNDPAAWHAQLDEGLGEDFPMFAVAGNHDTSAWDGYRDVLMDRLEPIKDADCSGEIGVQSNCLYRGVDLVLSGVGTMFPESKIPHVDYLTETLAESPSIWRVCAWHKNQHDMQLGGKGNEVGWGAYQACQDGGAIVATGHEHTYGRTKTLTQLGNEKEGHGAIGEADIVEVGPGRTFVFVSGMGGTGIRAFGASHEDDTWWATQYTSNVYTVNGVAVDEYEPELGVLFIDFHVDGDPYKAHGYFKNLTGEMIDEFTIFAQHE
jgi:predicted phosphodiesterase